MIYICQNSLLGKRFFDMLKFTLLIVNFMNIIIYTKTGCPWCRDVLALLSEKKVPFEERNVSSNKNYFQELLAKSGQSKTPTLDIDKFILSDSDKDQVYGYLSSKGVAGF